MSHDDTIDITVSYTGVEPFHEVVHGNPTFHQVKLTAIRAFGIEASAADRYVLQYEGTDVDEKRHVDSLGKETVHLSLTLAEEPVKG